MGTRSNFYKNTSHSYKKNLSIPSLLQNLNAYNFATGNVPPLVRVNPSRKRLRKNEPRSVANGEMKNSEGPVSHQEYVDRKRKDEISIGSSSGFQRLEDQVLKASSYSTQLVDYESDQSNPDDGDEQQIQLTSDNITEGDQITGRSEQRYALPGEPTCVICGKYGEYVCNETDDDVCSMDCKLELLQNLKLAEEHPSDQSTADFSSRPETTFELDLEGDQWDSRHNRWAKKRSSLCTYECWKCQKPGHLPEDCLVGTGAERIPIPGVLRALYQRCHKLSKCNSTVNCNDCHTTSSLATCLDCNTIFCDNAGHLSQHITHHPSHGNIYSYELKRLVKCCKVSCKVTDIRDLLVCHYCFSKAFDKFYSMFTATWKPTGLSMIWGSICCEEHFAWHRMNCLNSDVEDAAFIIRRTAYTGSCNQLNDFIF